MRAAYGYTDAEIFEHIQAYGQAWMDEALRLITEDDKRRMEEVVEERRWLIHMLPLAQTPMSKKGARQLHERTKTLLRLLRDALPWVKEARDKAIRERLRNPPQNTKPIVIP